MVGTDSRDNLDDLEGFGHFEGARADVILLLIRPRNHQENTAIVSLPRDLWVATSAARCGSTTPCRVGQDMNGESTLLATVESLTGLGVDHVAIVDMAGFQEVVDRLGGYEICVENLVRHPKAKLDLVRRLPPRRWRRHPGPAPAAATPRSRWKTGVGCAWMASTTSPATSASGSS